MMRHRTIVAHTCIRGDYTSHDPTASPESSGASMRKPLQNMTNPIAYALEPELPAAEFVDLLIRSTLAERRPIDDDATVAGMLANADLIVTARTADGLLVGISRAITDHSYCTYLSDLAVDEAFQGRGIGRELIRRTHEAAGKHTSLILLSAPKAETYYPHIGMRRHESCWVIDRAVKAR